MVDYRLAARLDRVGDLRHGAALVQRLQRQARRRPRSRPGSSRRRLTATDGKVMSVPGTKKSWVNWVPGLPSLARSVITEALLLSSVGGLRAGAPSRRRDAAGEETSAATSARPRRSRLRRRPPPPKLRRRCGSSWWSLWLRGGGATVRVTMMSVPTEPSGRKHTVLGVGEPVGDPDDAHHETHTGGESEGGDERPPPAAAQLVPGITEREHVTYSFVRLCAPEEAQNESKCACCVSPGLWFRVGLGSPTPVVPATPGGLSSPI